ncbi:protein FAM171B isoform X2 [Cynoglossus semilaevis]|uniref:protein FAM171B isoform X2 n=1 Tax=Cynoglossus semilaevis TaxID=244447 RepID=UPI0007DC8680|nr:protein FAM171B isoform X2 [Cynoglossus semilaevis]
MAALDRLLPLLLISCLLLDGAARAAAAEKEEVEKEEGGGLRASSPANNGVPAGDTGGSSPERPLSDSSSWRTEDHQFALKVLVRDQVTRQPLSGASVDVYVNHTLRSSVQTRARGEVLLWVTFSPGLSLTLLGSMEGYVPCPLPWRTSKRPIFSSVTLLLLPHSQGNVWLFDDSVLITGKLPDSSSQPSVKFPKNLLGPLEMSNASSVTAYLTVPQHCLAKDCGNCTQGIVSNKSVLRSVDLKAVAAVSVLLYSGDEKLQVRGPIQISLPLGHNTHLRATDTVPAWAFNQNTGAWENQGLGIVKNLGDGLVWTYTASHLGFWLAAPLPSISDYHGHGSAIEFLSSHTYLLIGVLGGTLVIIIVCLSLLLCHCRSSNQKPRRRRARFSKLTAVKKDQTTSTHMEEGLLFRMGDNSLASCSVQCEPSSTPRHKANYNIYVEDPGSLAAPPLYENISSDRIKSHHPPHYINSDEVARIRDKSEQNRANLNTDSFFPDKLVHIYNQPVAIIQAPELFGAQEQQLSGCKSATFPRNGVPGTLNEAAGMGAFGGGHVPSELQGISERTLLELTRGKSSSSHPRAWFVSLDGKPAAQVRHSIIELQSRHRPPSSNDTSLDSGVDMNEPQQNIRETERDRPSIRASFPHHGRGGRYGEEQDLSSSESGTTTTCTPEDPSLRNILDGSSGAIPNIPEERDGMDTSSAQEDSESRGTPPPRRLRKVREKAKTEKRSAKQVREGRPLTKRS